MAKQSIILKPKQILPKYYVLVFYGNGKYHMRMKVAYTLEEAISKATKNDDALTGASLWWHNTDSLSSIESQFKEYGY